MSDIDDIWDDEEDARMAFGSMDPLMQRLIIMAQNDRRRSEAMARAEVEAIKDKGDET